MKKERSELIFRDITELGRLLSMMYPQIFHVNRITIRNNKPETPNIMNFRVELNLIREFDSNDLETKGILVRLAKLLNEEHKPRNRFQGINKRQFSFKKHKKFKKRMKGKVSNTTSKPLTSSTNVSHTQGQEPQSLKVQL